MNCEQVHYHDAIAINYIAKNPVVFIKILDLNNVEPAGSITFDHLIFMFKLMVHYCVELEEVIEQNHHNQPLERYD